MSGAKSMPPVAAFSSAYPGSMSDAPDGEYVRRDDPLSLAAALVERVQEAELQVEDLQGALDQAHEALREIALAGMSGSGQESEEGMRAWHARQAWKFIGIAARALPTGSAA